MSHGLGDSGAGWVSLAQNWRLRQKFDEVKFIFPNAPTIPITVVRSELHYDAHCIKLFDTLGITSYVY